ncbi:MAG: sulfite exporter TauE/SafE family protein [Thermotogota bacterium]|nr:sulfite exporter TauE/SafE family protein [Thermotogota bacterium]
MWGEIGIFIVVGFLAQLIDGALGMAYGVSSNTFLLSLGIQPAISSSSVHIAEVFTTGVSGFSHFKLGNINKKLFLKLIIPGVAGGVIGAYILTQIPGSIIKPFIAIYLAIMGILILVKLFKKSEYKEVDKGLKPLAVIGGFFDAIGGGGWGPIVTSTLVANGNHPRFTIGSVNASEFFVTLAEAITFIAILGIVRWPIVVGLIIGGVIAAPFAAYLCKKLPPRLLMLITGSVVIFLSVRTMALAWF